MEFSEFLIAAIAVLSIFALPIATGLVLGITFMRNRHKERMGLINQGIIPHDTPRRKATPNRFVSLRNGIVLASIGVGLSVGLLLGKYVLNMDEDSIFWVISASILLFLGLGYLTYFFVTRNKIDESETDIVE